MSDIKTNEKVKDNAEKAVIKILKSFAKLQELAKENNFEKEHQDQILKVLRKEVENTKKSFSQSKEDEIFQLK